MKKMTEAERLKLIKLLHGKTVDIMGSPWTIEIYDGDGGENILGASNIIIQKLLVARHNPDPGSTLFHESCHAVENTLGIELDENEIRAFEVGLRQILRANPILVKALLST